MFTNLKNRKYIEHEFEHAKWEASTGMNPSEIEAEFQRMYDTSTEPMPILRAKMYEFVLDNAQIEINPKNSFSAKFNIGVNYENFATQDYIQHTIYITQRDKVRKRILNILENSIHFPCLLQHRTNNQFSIIPLTAFNP